MYNLFLEDGDLLEAVQLESLFNSNKSKKSNSSMKRIESIDKVIQIMKNTIKNDRYNYQFQGAIKIKYFKDNNKNIVATYDCLDYSTRTRTDEREYLKWDGMLKSFINEVNTEINKIKYKIKSSGGHEEGFIILTRYSTYK